MALNPALIRASSGTPTLQRAAGTAFSGNLVYGVWSVWLSDPLFATPGHHSFNVSFDDTPTGSIYWELSVGIDNNNSVTVAVVRQNSPGTMTAFSWASDVAAWPACQGHVLLSFDLVAGVAQAYINDAPMLLGSSSPPAAWFTAGIPFGSSVTVSDQHPGGGYVADLWFGRMASFVDLTVTANRRKFINADLTPVDLGPAGATPFGTAPTLFQTIPAGGIATDFLTNRGTAGGTFTPVGSTIIDAPGDPCAVTSPLPKLAMDDVNCTTIPDLSQNLVFLEWSDDRGHHYGNPVGQPIGEAGEYRTSLQWQRLGMSRDRVFRIFWSVPTNTALQGCWLDATPAQS